MDLPGNAQAVCTIVRSLRAHIACAILREGAGAAAEPDRSPGLPGQSCRSAAWVAALVMMALADVLTRLVVVYLRGHRLAGTAAGPALIPAGTGA